MLHTAFKKTDESQELLTRMHATLFNKLRRCILLLLSLHCLITAASQQQEKKVTFGLKAGMGVSNLGPSFTDTAGGTYSYNSKASFSGGLRLFIPVNKNIIFLPELVLIFKGAMESYDGDPNMYFFQSGYPVSLFYLEIPLNINYKIPVKSGQFLIGGGPAPAIKLANNYYGPNFSRMIAYDLGINFLSCYQFPIGFSIEVNYNLGVANIGNDPDQPLRNKNFGISIGYAF